MLLPFSANLNAGNDIYRDYVGRWAGTAVHEMKRSGVPASVTLAQGLLESAAGQSELARQGNNHFGIKCHSAWTGAEFHKDAEIKDECFRAYNDASESFRDHSDFLRYQDRYRFLFDLEPTDYKGWAEGLKKAGYATDPAYPRKLVKLIEEYELFVYDSGVTPEVQSPAAAEAPAASQTNPLTAVLRNRIAENVSISLSRTILEKNGVPFVSAVEGERFSDIAASFGLFTDELLRYNDAQSDYVLRADETVYLAPKKKMAAVGLDKFIPGPGESFTIREISQRFAVRSKSLCRMNSVSESHVFREADVIVLRK